MALEGLELAGAPEASVKEFVLLCQTIVLLFPPTDGFLERKKAAPMITKIAFINLPLGISVIKLLSQ